MNLPYLKTIADGQRAKLFDLNAFAERQQRSTRRLVRAAWATGKVQPHFAKLAPSEQEQLVQTWVEDALMWAAVRRGEMAAP